MSRTHARVTLGAVLWAVLVAQVMLYPGIDRLVMALGAETELDASMWFLAAEFAAFISFASVWGAASDVAGKRVPFIVAGAVGGAVGYSLLAVLPLLTGASFGSILGLRVLQGAATIGAFSLAMTMLMDLEGGHGSNMGVAGIAIGLGTAMGAPIGGFLYGIGAFVPLYAASGLLLGAGLLTLLVEDRAPRGSRRRLAAVLLGLRRTPALGLPYLFGFIDRLTAGVFALVGTLYFRQVFQLDPAATGLTLALFFAPFALLQYPFGVLSDRIGRTVPIVAGSMTYGVGVVAVGLVGTITQARLAMVAVGICGALMAPATMALVTDLADAAERGVAMAGFNIAGSLGFLAGIVGGGLLAGWQGYQTTFLVAGGSELLLAGLALPVFFRLTVERTERFAG